MPTRRARRSTNLHHVRIFHTLATTGSFTGAARRLGISQPAVAIQVRELEAASGVRLLERGARRLHLTAAGRALLRVTERPFALVDEAETLHHQDRAQAAVVRAFLTLARSRRRGGPPPS
jgi:DNA-binding transcriptional LysR family regulator